MGRNLEQWTAERVSGAITTTQWYHKAWEF